MYGVKLVHLQTMKPAHFRFSNSFRNSSNFSSTDLPVYSNPRTSTLLFGRDGRSLPHTRSTRLSLIGLISFPPFFLILSANFLASAFTCQPSPCMHHISRQTYRQSLLWDRLPLSSRPLIDPLSILAMLARPVVLA